jgi:hypothetical protein
MNVSTIHEGQIAVTFITDDHRKRRVTVAHLDDGRTTVGIEDHMLTSNADDVIDENEQVFNDRTLALRYAALAATESSIDRAFARYIDRARQSRRIL